MKKITVIATIWSLAVPAMADIELGWIERIDGDPGDVRVLRAGQMMAARPFLPLERGDRISVEAARTKVVITFPNRLSPMEVNQSTPFEIEDTAHTAVKVPSVASNLLAWMGSLGKKDVGLARVAVTATRQGQSENQPQQDPDTLEVPLVTDDTVVVAGKRQLAVSWRGGKPPFTASLVRMETQEVVASLSGLAVNNFIAKAELFPGAYEIVITDAKGRIWRERLIEVIPGPIPTAPSELQDLPTESRRILTAAWLASFPGGRWVLEGYSLLALQPEPSPAEARLMQALAVGDTPH